jgi:hypothetical protein
MPLSAANNKLQDFSKSRRFKVATLNSTKTEACARANTGIGSNLVNRFVKW